MASISEHTWPLAQDDEALGGQDAKFALSMQISGWQENERLLAFTSRGYIECKDILLSLRVIFERSKTSYSGFKLRLLRNISSNYTSIYSGFR
jgi:hypothetical protein